MSPTRRSNGKFVHRCPKCTSQELRVFSYQCLVCEAEFPKPTRQVFRTRADALRAHGAFYMDTRKRPREYYVDVCPRCDAALMVESKFRCTCGGAFNRWEARLLWEVGVNGS